MARRDTTLNGRGFAYNNTLWLIDRGQRRGIPSDAVKNRLFEGDKDFHDNPALGDIEQGPGINLEARMINDGTTVYFFDNGEARAITSSDVKKKYGFHGGDYIDPSVVEKLPKGDVIAD